MYLITYTDLGGGSGRRYNLPAQHNAGSSIYYSEDRLNVTNRNSYTNTADPSGEMYENNDVDLYDDTANTGEEVMMTYVFGI